MNILDIIGRKSSLFETDIKNNVSKIQSIIEKSSFLVVGGAGSIGSSVVKQIFKYNPKKVHVVDLSENNLVELVRDVRSDQFIDTNNLKTFPIDCGSVEFDFLVQKNGPYDFVFNLSALKHVRSEKDPFSLMRMVVVNILNTVKIAKLSKEMGARKYFCVSTDKAANPVNMMGASKRIMEMFLYRESADLVVSMARFANVAFSDGSLLYGFEQRIKKKQPIAAPKDIKRYFVTSQEAGQLCLISGILGHNKEIFFPKLNVELHQATFPQIAESYLKFKGYVPALCKSEEEARSMISALISEGKWPCYFSESVTTGEKEYEEFFTADEYLNLTQFKDIGIVKSLTKVDEEKLDTFLDKIDKMRKAALWERKDIIELFQKILPLFNHKETGKFLDEKM
ncbi:UDP-N-acetylglucosamine 4,6-dehydratase [Alphaproteobacteria bacterium]|nr:UDP-N-acetylglucosamine 4,6-dehydratase [Alphaproteobacteria bacterium]